MVRGELTNSVTLTGADADAGTGLDPAAGRLMSRVGWKPIIQGLSGYILARMIERV